jgi:signal transduction histidine kinase
MNFAPADSRMDSDDQHGKDRVRRPGALATVYLSYDLQNVLMVMGECMDVIRVHLAPADRAVDAFTDLEGCLASALHVSRQLLASADPDPGEPVFTDVNTVILDVLSMLQRLLGPRIPLSTRLSGEVPVVQARAVEIEWLLMNLAANARDAMPDGGHAQIETALVDVWSPELLGTVAWAERYVRLTFSDSGHRVPVDVRERMFAPPAANAKSTPSGIGLSRMSLTVRTLGGWIDAEGEEGVGIRVHIHLPIGTAVRRN